MNTNARESLNRQFFSKFIKSYSYFLCSIIVHIIMFYIIGNIAIKPVTIDSTDKQVRLSMHNAYRMNMQDGVKNIAKIERDLMDTLDESAKNSLNLEPIDDKAIVNTKATPSQLLELAHKISENIRKIERELRARDLERAVTMSHNDALKTVMSLELAIPEYRANKMPGAEMVRSVERLEENAKNSLHNRKEDMKARGIGEPLSKSQEKNITTFNFAGNSSNTNIVKDTLKFSKTFIDSPSLHAKNDFVDVWLDHIPSVNHENPKKIAGRILKDGAQYADRIFVNSWYVIGPFSVSASKHPPEYAVDLDAIYYGKDNQTVSWQYLSNASYPLTPPQIDKSGVFFGFTEIIVDREQDLWIWVGADDFANLSLNGNTIWQSEVFNKKFNGLVNDKNNIERDNWNLTEYKRLVHFNAGRNTFKFKLTNSDASAFFSLVITK